MGIDVYMHWDGQTEAEKEAQITGFSLVSGHLGYLREAYHGDVYATRVLLPEGFEPPGENEEKGVEFPAAVLRERLPATIKAVIRRHLKTYGERLTEEDDVVQAFVRFVELAEAKERETGQPVRIYVSY